jgi:dTDP-4-dehydrorhamnose 3,5-epimerase-like enzyme|tara:strand:- start:2889 stop:3296 length:408 start_codon:yes stop_codon:yes gene_type:complete
MKTIQDVRMIDFPSVVGDGSLVPVELESKIPFDVKRIFYVYDVGTLEKRGCHAHLETNQVLVCLKGSIKCICKDQFGGEVSVVLASPTTGIHIPEMIWDEQIYLSEDSILLSFCSTNYDKQDYIEDWEDFKNGHS